MRAVVQRVSRASVSVDGAVVGEVGAGLLVLLGVATADTAELAERLAGKIARLRIFERYAKDLLRDRFYRKLEWQPFGFLIIMALWALFCFVFFSLSQSKLAPYILPMFPALALLAAAAVHDMDGRQLRRWLWAPVRQSVAFWD